MELKWEPNYRTVKLPSAWSAAVENQLSGKSKRCNIGDLKLKHLCEDWELKPSCIGRADKYVNHPDNLPEVDFSVDKPSNQQIGTEPKYKTKQKMERKVMIDFLFSVDSLMLRCLEKSYIMFKLNLTACPESQSYR